jgi:3-phosphoshikimate 1-carboxyvinyltransferase
MIEIQKHNIKDCIVKVSGSKSYTHRIIIAAALSDGICTIYNALKSEDTLLTISALKKMGTDIKEKNDKIIVHGKNGKFMPYSEPIYLENSGTSMRLLTSVAALGKGKYTFTGTDRLCQRPMLNLIDALKQINISIRSFYNNGCPPVEIIAGDISGGKIQIKCDISSQFLSGLLLIAPYMKNGLDISVIGEPVSKPYIDMTIEVMKMFGISCDRLEYKKFIVKNGQVFKSGSFKVEPDCSSAGYFWGAAAITGANIKVLGINKASKQGDIELLKLLEKMGCEITYENDGIAVKGSELNSIEADMADMPDMAPTLAVIAAFAKGITVIKNVGHLKAKESDRLSAVTNELNKIGIKASCSRDKMIIEGGVPKASFIKTYDDHRIAMSFAIAGLKIPGIIIENEKCVEKSFPDFWNVFNSL